MISLIFTSCHHICPSTTQHLQQVVSKAQDALDDDSFAVITVGFDTANDSPERMAEFGKKQRRERSILAIPDGDEGRYRITGEPTLASSTRPPPAALTT